MWTRAELKDKAKVAFKGNYWMSVLAGLILTFFATGASSGGRNANDDSGQGLSEAMSGDFMAIVIAVVVGIVLTAIFFEILKIVVGNALIIGAKRIFLGNEIAQEKPGFNEISYVFKSGNWKNVVITMFLKDLFVSLWSLLFVIPGIIKSYEYRMIPFLLAENPSMSREDAFAESKRLMNGQKMNAFILDLSFIPWVLAEVVTCGIAGVFYVNPYIYQTDAELYLKLKSL